MLDWVPDSVMVRIQYRIHMGRPLDMVNPQRYTEKLQLYKLRYRNPLMLRCTDKYEVRKVIEEMGLSECLVPMIGIYDKESEIDFDRLPSKFVVKTTDGGGGVQVFVCKDKSTVERKSFFSMLQGWMSAPRSGSLGREWAYYNSYPRRLLIEELLEEDGKNYLTDYKFFCFDGKVRMIYGITDRDLGNRAKFGIYTPDFKLLDVVRNGELPPDGPLPKPVGFDEMVSLSEKLSSHFPHVRVDLYNVGGKVYFGELTFYNGSGYVSFTPDSWDFTLGSYFTEY